MGQLTVWPPRVVCDATVAGGRKVDTALARLIDHQVILNDGV